MSDHLEDVNTRSEESTDPLQMAHEALLEKINANGNLPALGSSVSRVVQLASSDDEAVRSLAHFIMSDVGLTQKILRISNAACFRNQVANSRVTTISKAIFLLGFDTVKTCALGMLLVDRMPSSRAVGVRKELLHALSASMFGREVARRSQQKDGEEAAIAALFGNIGRLLVAAHDQAHYDEINILINEGTTATKAARQVIGSSYEKLGETVMTDWEMPESIIQAQAPLAAGPLRTARNRQEWIHQVAAFSNAAAQILAQSGNPEAAIAALLSRFGTALNLGQAKLSAMLLTVAEEVSVMAAQLQIAPVAPATPLPLLPIEGSTASLWHALEGEDTNLLALPAEFLLQAADADDAPQCTGRHPSGKPLNARELLLAGVQDVTEMVASGRCKTNDLIMLVLETLYRGMGFRFATVCIKDVKSNQFRARISLGENNVERQAGFVFSATVTRDLFHLAMGNEADVLISDAADIKIRDLIPAWHRALLPDARSFIVLPLIVQKKSLGLFYADRILPANEGVPPDEAALIKTLKAQVVAALNSR